MVCENFTDNMKRKCEERGPEAQKVKHDSLAIVDWITENEFLFQNFAECIDLQTYRQLSRVCRRWRDCLLPTRPMQVKKWLKLKQSPPNSYEARIVMCQCAYLRDAGLITLEQNWNFIDMLMTKYGWVSNWNERNDLPWCREQWRMMVADETIASQLLPTPPNFHYVNLGGNCLTELALQGRSLDLIKALHANKYWYYTGTSINQPCTSLDLMHFDRVEEANLLLGEEMIYCGVTRNEHIMRLVYTEDGLASVLRHPWLLYSEHLLKFYAPICRTLATEEAASSLYDPLFISLLSNKFVLQFCDRFKEGTLDRPTIEGFMHNVRLRLPY